MHVEYHNQLQQSVVADCSRVLVKDDAGNPLVIVVKVPGTIVVSVAGDPDFNAVLRNLGIQATTVVKNVREKSIDSIAISR